LCECEISSTKVDANWKEEEGSQQQRVKFPNYWDNSRVRKDYDDRKGGFMEETGGGNEKGALLPISKEVKQKRLINPS